MTTRELTPRLARHDQPFAPEPESAMAARRFVRDCLAEHAIASYTAELIVSELMANVIQHARTELTVVVRVGTTLRLEVHDGSSIIPAMRQAADDAESGRGLFIIEAIALDWGVETTADGKCVWVEIAPEEA